MSYSVQIKRSASRAIARLPHSDRVRIVHAIERLSDNPLSGRLLKGSMRGLRRVRVGQYRVVYEVLHGELVVLVVLVAHRREAYRH